MSVGGGEAGRSQSRDFPEILVGVGRGSHGGLHRGAGHCQICVWCQVANGYVVGRGETRVEAAVGIQALLIFIFQSLQVSMTGIADGCKV